MKIGFDMMLWTTHVGDAHRPILADIKKTGYDGVEIPIFEGTPDYFAGLGRTLDDIGLERTGISVIGALDANPLSASAEDRQRGVDHMSWIIDCTAALGAKTVAGPLHSTIGHFSGSPPTEAERERARDFHRRVGDIAAKSDVRIALEAINRFECYFVNTMDDLSRYVASVGHPNIKAMYDTFHANLEEDDPVGAYARNSESVIHVHISENNRGVPGRGHVPWAETFSALRRSGYDGWLTIEAFGRSLPALAAATMIWRDLSEAPEEVYRDGFVHIRDGWAAAKAQAAKPRRKIAAKPKRAAKPRRSAAKPRSATKPAQRRRAKPAGRARKASGGSRPRSTPAKRKR
jgi:D-psicose/D-tagatose/L-ribulose 3-epimerase